VYRTYVASSANNNVEGQLITFEQNSACTLKQFEQNSACALKTAHAHSKQRIAQSNQRMRTQNSALRNQISACALKQFEKTAHANSKQGMRTQTN
jgi:hypothetical protein